MNPEKRYELLVEAALASEELWSLEASGRLIRYRLQDGNLALPLWPSQELAALESPDASEQPRRLSLEEILESILPEIINQKAWVAAFPLKGDSFVVDPQVLLDRFIQEWDEDD
jgi:hypothetical protein